MGSKYTGEWVNVAYPDRTEREACDIEAHKQLCLTQHNERRAICEAILKLGYGEARAWLSKQPEALQEGYRAMLNRLRLEKRK